MPCSDVAAEFLVLLVIDAYSDPDVPKTVPVGGLLLFCCPIALLEKAGRLFPTRCWPHGQQDAVQRCLTVRPDCRSALAPRVLPWPMRPGHSQCSRRPGRM